MTAAVRQWILGLCGAAAVCAIALAVCPEGKVRKVTRLVCGAVMTLALISPVMDFNFAAYSEAMAEYSEEARDLGEGAKEESDRLSRTIIENECAAYILDKADALGVALSSVSVTARWSDEGCWYPYEAEISAVGAQQGEKALAEAVESDLGIPPQRQHWSEGA